MNTHYFLLSLLLAFAVPVIVVPENRLNRTRISKSRMTQNAMLRALPTEDSNSSGQFQPPRWLR